MDFIFCIPIMVGCPTKIHQDGDPTPRVCPRCHNAAVQSAKSRQWFELCFVPLIPMKARHIWICSICQWTLPVQPGWQPEVQGQQFAQGNPGGWQQGPTSPPAGYQPGYQPAYINQGQKPN